MDNGHMSKIMKILIIKKLHQIKNKYIYIYTHIYILK